MIYIINVQFFILDKSHIDEISSNLNAVINDRINIKKIFLEKENENSIFYNNIRRYN